MSRGERAGEAFLPTRWSRLKRAEAEPPEVPEVDRAARPRKQRLSLTDRSDAEILEDLGLPDPETTGTRLDDFTGFHAGRPCPRICAAWPCVSLWRLNPTLANLDGLVEYGEDYHRQPQR